MLAVLLAAVSISSSYACEPYFSLGSGPYILMPNIGAGARFDDTSGKVDINLSYSHETMIQIIQLTASKLLYTPNGLYCGPSYGFSFHKIKYMGSGSDCLLGIVVGKEFRESFFQLDLYKRVQGKGMKINTYQTKFKIGIKF